MSRCVALVLAALCAGGAAAQTQVYRCGTDGRSYSQEPCAGGRAIEVADPRSAQQAAQARQAVQREVRAAQALEQARWQAERQAARQGPTLIGWSRPTASADEKRCAKGAKSCQREKAANRRPDKVHAVTLFRGADSASR